MVHVQQARFPIVFGALALVLFIAVLPVVARGQAFCDDGQPLSPGTAYVALEPVLGDALGEPLECEHATTDGDLVQATTSGLVVYQADTNAPSFTNGQEHWALVDGQLIYRADENTRGSNPVGTTDQPAAEVVPTPLPAPTASPPPAGLLPLAWQDATTDPTHPYMYWAKHRCTFGAQAFSKSSSDADVVLSYNPAVDESLDKPNILRLTISWTGPAQARTANGTVASARDGDLTVRWTSYEDRIVQDIVVSRRPAGDRLDFLVSGRGFVWSRLAGGYALFDVGAFERFIIHGPTINDAHDKTSAAILNWNYPAATIPLDPNLAYPATVSMAVEYAGIRC